MTSNDDSRRGNKPAGSKSSGKRPFATLDLRPVEIEDATPEKEPSKQGTREDKVHSKSEETSPSRDDRNQQSAQTQTSSAANGAAEPKTIVKRRGVFGPLVGGVLGGLLALFGGDYLLDRFGIPQLAGSATRSMDGVEARLADLEQQIAETSASGNGNGASTAALDPELTQRLENIKALTKAVAELSEKQALLREDVKTLQTAAANEATNNTDDSELAERFAGLEQRFANLANVTASSSDGGGLPQLPALTAKIADLEAQIAKQAASSTPQPLPDEAQTKLGEALATATTAKQDIERLSQTVATAKTTTNRVEQRTEALKTEADKLSESIKILNETTLKMSADISSLRNSLQTELGSVARPADINAAVTPYKDRIANLEKTLGTLEKQEAERSRRAKNVVLSLELEDLRRAVESGKPFADEIQSVKSLAGDNVDLGSLETHASRGIASRTTLEAKFRPLIHEMLAVNTTNSGSLFSQLVDQAKSVVRVRKVNHDADDTSPEAIVARMESNLKAGKLDAVLTEAKRLPEENREPAKSWLDLVRAHASVHKALARLNTDLKTSLSKATLTPQP